MNVNRGKKKRGGGIMKSAFFEYLVHGTVLRKLTAYKVVLVFTKVLFRNVKSSFNFIVW